jgi:hypothetical protein
VGMVLISGKRVAYSKIVQGPFERGTMESSVHINPNIRARKTCTQDFRIQMKAKVSILLFNQTSYCSPSSITSQRSDLA